MSTVRIEPRDGDDANRIAMFLEKILPWPGYALEPSPWPRPSAFRVPTEVADQVFAELYPDKVVPVEVATVSAEPVSEQAVDAAEGVQSSDAVAEVAADVEPSAPVKKAAKAAAVKK